MIWIMVRLRIRMMNVTIRIIPNCVSLAIGITIVVVAFVIILMISDAIAANY